MIVGDRDPPFFRRPCGRAHSLTGAPLFGKNTLAAAKLAVEGKCSPGTWPAGWCPARPSPRKLVSIASVSEWRFYEAEFVKTRCENSSLFYFFVPFSRHRTTTEPFGFGA